MKRLIVNADDFGLTSGVNHAILECYQRGIVTSTTLMANSQNFEDAVSIAKSLAPNVAGIHLSVGCHVVLVDGGPVLPPSEVRTLLEPGTNRFYRSIQELTTRAIGNKFEPKEIEAEATAQFHRLQSAGISISHFDAHKHAHMFSAILGPVLRAAQACGIPAVRNPFEPISRMPLLTLLRAPVRYAQVAALRTLRSKFCAMVSESGLETTEGSFGVVATGRLNTGTLTTILDKVPDGVWELVCHPGYNDAQLATAGTRLLASREIEMQALTSESVQDALRRNGVQLVSFRDLPGTLAHEQGSGFESDGGNRSSNKATNERSTLPPT